MFDPISEFGFQRNSKAARFLRIAQPDEDGFSRVVPVAEFTGSNEDLKFGNGVDWARSTSKIANVFNIQIIKEGGTTVALKLNGFNKNPVKKPIPRWIAKEMRQLRCPVLGTSDVEPDHKDGRLDDRRTFDSKSVNLDDFQPLSKAANMAKRQACKECRETGQRFDAQVLGFSISQFKGNGAYRGTCVGCYWHDVRRFHGEVSAK